MITYAKITLVGLLMLLSQFDGVAQNSNRSVSKDSSRLGVDDYTADYYKVSRPDSKGDYNNTYILNNGGDNFGSIAFATMPSGGSQSRVCLDVRPSGETQVLAGPRRNDPMLMFKGSYAGLWGRITSTGHLAFAANSRLITGEDPDLFIHGNGSLGIGTVPPDQARAKLYVNGNINVEGANQIKVSLGTAQVNGLLGTVSNHNFRIGANVSNGQYSLFFNRDNKYLIVNADKAVPPVSEAHANKYGLFVLKGILSEGFAISPGNSWADYVFDKNYPLLPMDSIEAFINKHGHLPHLPSASQVEEQGYDLHQINMLFLEKIEELTLYNIDAAKQIKQQKQQIELLKAQMKEVEELSGQVMEIKKLMNLKKRQ